MSFFVVVVVAAAAAVRGILQKKIYIYKSTDLRLTFDASIDLL